jgi:lipoate-protein ligase A
MPPLVASTHDLSWRKLKLSYPSAAKNLAVEEALARALSIGVQTQPTLRIWTNPKAVIVGRFQDVVEEVDARQCELNEVRIARRFTGGGTVFHDEKTLNLTVATRSKGSLGDLGFQETNLQLVKQTLDELGLHCSTLRNSILINGRKVCGAAAAVGLHFALWHCSILVDTNTELLELTLRPSKSVSKSRFVHSQWREVTTLTKALSGTYSSNELMKNVEKTLEARMKVKFETSPLIAEEEKNLQTLYSRKYSSNKWNMTGKSGFA